MMDSQEIDEQQSRSAMNGGGGGGGGGGGAVRRRPPTAPFAASATSHTHTYGTNEENSLLHSSRHNEEGYPFPHEDRHRSHRGGSRHLMPWYRQPQKLILAATLAWVGGVMYLASLAHAILRTHKETSNMMGNSLMDDHEGFKQFLHSQGKQNKHGSRAKKYGSSLASDEDVNKYLELRNGQAYGSSAETDEDFQEWMASRSNNEKHAASGNTYGDGDDSENSVTYGDFEQWMENQYEKLQNSYSASDETLSDFQDWMENQRNKYGASRGKGGGGKSNEAKVRFGNGNGGNGDAWQDWLEYLDSEKSANSGSSSSSSSKGYGATNGVPDEWLQYQNKNQQVKYNANGNYGKSPHVANYLGASQSAVTSTSLSSEQQQQPVVATADPSLSTIDWPVQGLVHTSCTASNNCSPSTNVTVLIVYGPEYHTHISEMAWNVATGVHNAFQSHIRHHPSSPLHGHIVYGHTSNLTFLDVMEADAVIIGSPVYNGNIHPDVQNWINFWHIDADLSNKFGGAFVTAGGIHAGADGTIMSILRSMMVFQMMAVGGDSWTSPFGAAATMYEDPFGDTQRTEYFDEACYFTQDTGRQGDHLVHPYFLRKAMGLGERISNVTVAWKNSSYVRWS